MPEVDLSRLPQPLRILSETSSPPQRPGFWARLRDLGLTSFIVGLISTVAAALTTVYFQYNRWDVDQRLARAKTDFEAADQTFRTISGDLARMQSLQEILFFLYKDATASPTPEKAGFLLARGRETFVLYEKGRVELRAKIDSYIFDVRRHLDWASTAGTPELILSNGIDLDPLSYGKIAQSAAAGEFDCAAEKSMPQSSDHQTFEPSRFKGWFDVDWRSSTHHLIIFNYCFRTLHNLIEPARIWAGSPSPANPPTANPTAPVAMTGPMAQVIGTQLNNQVQRLNGFSALGSTQVEQVRLNSRPISFLDFISFRRP
ncbi:hypothetical protein GCM10007301_08000 [Azorhizobium oxalatiphilum]|uniref:Uncharacterized protein n=1 Tax=Azorhizobium oxalatiphilum TaxID=980631 RepID=A0A917BLP1_9HYPH|nr:hypothetical protein [Azorhizobium oxalatiphilum]GGF50999.1 hypothetical protein GCM10007301_08000 [Azorhizobium oxalatiphilum]